jgi:hypothetical protein
MAPGPLTAQVSLVPQVAGWLVLQLLREQAPQ